MGVFALIERNRAVSSFVQGGSRRVHIDLSSGAARARDASSVDQTWVAGTRTTAVIRSVDNQIPHYQFMAAGSVRPRTTFEITRFISDEDRPVARSAFPDAGATHGGVIAASAFSARNVQDDLSRARNRWMRHDTNDTVQQVAAIEFFAYVATTLHGIITLEFDLHTNPF